MLSQAEPAEPAENEDATRGQFLDFLARDIANHPERLQAIDANVVQRLRSLTRGVEVDLATPLSADGE
jgi:antitoxin PrlF